MVTTANAWERGQVAALGGAYEATRQTVALAHVDPVGSSARAHGIELEVMKHTEAEKGPCGYPAPSGRALVRGVRPVPAVGPITA